jgi:hypothetical protein
MAITSIMRDWGVSPAIVRITTSNTLSEVAQAGYVTAQEQNVSDLNHGTFEWLVGDLILIAASDGDNFFQFTGNDFSTFVPVAGGGGGGVSSITGTANQVIASSPTGNVVLSTPQDIATDSQPTFQDINVMDTVFVGDPTGASIGAGTVQLFSDGVNKGTMLWTIIDNVGNFFIQIQNDSYGQNTYLSLPDPANADGKFLIGPGLTPFISGNIPMASGTSGVMVDSGVAASSIPVAGGVGSFITKDIDINATDLNGFGQLFLENPSPGQSFIIRNAMVNLSNGMTGGGGDRGIVLQDGLGILFWVQATLVQTPANTLWGQTNLDFSPSAPQNRTTAVGAGMWFTYFAGGTDYDSGDLMVTVTYERVS